MKKKEDEYLNLTLDKFNEILSNLNQFDFPDNFKYNSESLEIENIILDLNSTNTKNSHKIRIPKETQEITFYNCKLTEKYIIQNINLRGLLFTNTHVNFLEIENNSKINVLTFNNSIPVWLNLVNSEIEQVNFLSNNNKPIQSINYLNFESIKIEGINFINYSNCNIVLNINGASIFKGIWLHKTTFNQVQIGSKKGIISNIESEKIKISNCIIKEDLTLKNLLIQNSIELEDNTLNHVFIENINLNTPKSFINFEKNNGEYIQFDSISNLYNSIDQLEKIEITKSKFNELQFENIHLNSISIDKKCDFNYLSISDYILNSLTFQDSIINDIYLAEKIIQNSEKNIIEKTLWIEGLSTDQLTIRDLKLDKFDIRKNNKILHLTTENCKINRLEFFKIILQKESNLFFRESIIQNQYYRDFKNYGTISFTDINLNKENESNLILENSDLGLASFSGCDLETYNFEYYNSVLDNATIIGGTAPKSDSIRINPKVQDKKEIFIQLASIYSQLNKIYLKQGNIFDASNYQKELLENQGKLINPYSYIKESKLLFKDFYGYYYLGNFIIFLFVIFSKTAGFSDATSLNLSIVLFPIFWLLMKILQYLPFLSIKIDNKYQSAKYLQDLIVFRLNKWSNNYGISWLHSILFIAISSIYIYILFYISNFSDIILSSNEIKIDYSKYFEFLNPTHKQIEFTGGIPSIWSGLYDFLGRIFVGYGIYQFYTAFRRFGKKGL